MSRTLTAAPAKHSLGAVPAVSSDGIPAAALAAYQRAAQVMSGTDPACGLSWPLLAAIGRVESDHGRYGGSVLTPDGVARPAIVGVPLNGARGTTRVADTDAGMYDGDATYDRAVGPMQFIPSTWAVAGVDGDGDQKRDPQDIDDAALAAAVYLCSGKDDLGTESGVTDAVYRYNHSHDYVTLVKSIADGYAEGSWSTVPTATYSTVTFSAAPFGNARRPAHHAPKPAAGTKHVEVHHVPAALPSPATQPAPGKPARDEPTKAGLVETVAELPETLQETVSGVVAGLGLEPLLGGLLKP